VKSDEESASLNKSWVIVENKNLKPGEARK
jgi:hypothetical protein